MNALLVDRLADKIIERLFQHPIKVEASGRHVHLSNGDIEKLFGKGYKLRKKSDLSQPGQFACEERVAIRGPKKTIDNVIVLGPARPDTQVEISATDALALGINAPVRMSGDLTESPGVTLVGTIGEAEIGNGVIIAKRHIHLSSQDAKEIGIVDGENVSVTIPGNRSLTFHNVNVRVSPDFRARMHIDYDEANSCGYSKGMVGLIHKPDRRIKLENIDRLVDKITAEVMRQLYSAEAPECDDTTLCFAKSKLIHEKELVEKCRGNVSRIRVSKKAIITHLAVEYLSKRNIAIERVTEDDE